MMLNGKILLVIILAVFNIACFNYVEAVPIVSGVSGTVDQGQLITVSGSRFGIKANTGLLLFGDFEKGTSGQSIISSSPNVE